MNRHRYIPTIITHLYLECYIELDIFKSAYLFILQNIEVCALKSVVMSKMSKFFSSLSLSLSLSLCQDLIFFVDCGS